MAAVQPNFGIPSEHEASFKALTQSTQEKVFLSRPESLESRDLCDGISDPPTLLCVALFARQFDPDGALKQFQEACEFREKKHILRLYDSVDISDFEQARQFVRNGEPPKPDMLQLASVYYDHLVRTIWRFLKAWVDPRTAEKIVVLMESEVLPTLREYIDDANIPANFGGEFQFTHGMLPDLDDNIQQLLNSGSSKSLPPGPLKWIKDSDGRQTALAVGSKSGSVRNDKIATLDIIAQ
ncbi:hypothetical protein E8E15_007255 [Penicillium rubens]|nr:hypothetical protein E8E15_007255 [Penicillium rubens]